LKMTMMLLLIMMPIIGTMSETGSTMTIGIPDHDRNGRGIMSRRRPDASQEKRRQRKRRSRQAPLHRR
jgi:hypothetical protein